MEGYNLNSLRNLVRYVREKQIGFVVATNTFDFAQSAQSMKRVPNACELIYANTDHSPLTMDSIDIESDGFLIESNSLTRTRARKRFSQMLAAARLSSLAHEKQVQHHALIKANIRVQEDLNAAAATQRQLLPKMHKDILGFHISSCFLPSSVVSGDMFNYFELTDNKLGFYAVDVAGHGINASLLAVSISHLITPEFFKSSAFDSDGTPNLASLVRTLNRKFCTSHNDGYFTMFCGIIDKTSGNMDICQAGYPSPIYVAHDGSSRFIGTGGFPVGMFPDATYENETTHFEEGGLLLICSDAASEAQNAQEVHFGDCRLRNFVAQHCATEIDSLPGSIEKTLRNWREGKALEDDLTVLVLKRAKRDVSR